MNSDRFFNILKGTVLASVVAYFVSGVLHAYLAHVDAMTPHAPTWGKRGPTG